MRLRGISLAAALAALCIAGSAAGTTRDQHVQRASLGTWRATLTYDQASGAGLPIYTHLRLAVWHDTKQLLDVPVVSSEPGATHPQPETAAAGKGSSLVFRDLDGDGMPDLLLRLYTGGAHCCFVDQVFDFSGAHPIKVELDLADWGGAIVLASGKPLLRTADDSFAYEFTAYAGTGAPILLLRYLGGKFEDVTRSHVQLVQADAARWWRASREGGAGSDARGVLAAWAADEAMLGHAATAKRTLLALAAAGKIGGESEPGWPTGSAYVTKLWSFLAKHGYV